MAELRGALVGSVAMRHGFAKESSGAGRVQAVAGSAANKAVATKARYLIKAPPARVAAARSKSSSTP